MNHLAHFYLSHPHEELMVGGFLGDFVKGKLTGKHPDQIELGIRLHRAIDAYTDRHPLVKQSQHRMDPEFHRYAGIITDIVYDHFLAQNWQICSPVSLQEFSENACKLVIKAKPLLPQNALKTILWMQSSAALVRYKDEAFIDRALKNISRRLSRSNPLANGFQQFEQNRSALEDDFLNFIPELKSFAEQWIVDSS